MKITDENKKKCGFCGEDISGNARRCPYCGSLLEVKPDEPSPAVPIQETYNSGFDAGISPGDTGESVSVENESTMENKNIINPVEPPVRQQVSGYEPPKPARKKPLSNARKVLLTVITSVIPGIGQLIGLITAIVFMNSEDDSDRRSFGVALMIASLIVFVVSCISCFILALALSSVAKA